jgi:hypothetical protein
MELTVRGGILQGLLGPVFLLAPLGLLALRWPLGRQFVLAALVFALPYPANLGTRFLFPALPFASYALAMVLVEWRVAAPAVVLFHAFFSWPGITTIYCDPYAWRLDKVSVRAALRQDKEEDWLPDRIYEYPTAKLIEQFVPPSGKVFSYGGIPESYCRREILIAYVAGFNNMLGETLASGMVAALQPLQRWTYRFPDRKLLGVRLVQTSTTQETWSVSELRVYNAAGELPRAEGWRVKASPNPWEVQLAFDNCPLTRWKAWERAKPGQYVEIIFHEPIAIRGVRADLTVDQVKTRSRLEGQTESGEWVVLAEAAEVTAAPPPSNARQIATDDLKRFGITHLSISNNDFIAGDLFRNRAAWNITLLGEAGGSRLYKLN